jgi:hypothetical protein
VEWPVGSNRGLDCSRLQKRPTEEDDVTRKTGGRLLAVVALAVLLASCIKLDMSLTVSADNTVSGSVVLAVDKQVLELTGQSVGDLLSGSGSGLPTDIAGVTSEPYEDDILRVIAPATSLDQFSASGGADSLQIVRRGSVRGRRARHVGAGGPLIRHGRRFSGDRSTGATEHRGSPRYVGFPGARSSSSRRDQDLIPSPAGRSSNGQIGSSTVWDAGLQRPQLPATASAVGGGQPRGCGSRSAPGRRRDRDRRGH